VEVQQIQPSGSEYGAHDQPQPRRTRMCENHRLKELIVAAEGRLPCHWHDLSCVLHQSASIKKRQASSRRLACPPISGLGLCWHDRPYSPAGQRHPRHCSEK
jgi:hypothetical protein